MSIYAFHENAPAMTAPGDADIFPVIQSGVLKQATAAILQGYGGTSVNVTAGATTLAVNQTAHANRVVTLSNTTPIVVTLPTSSGSGAKYTFVFQAAATATGSTIVTGNATDVFQGVVFSLNTTANAVIGFKTTAISDTMTFNGTTTGGAAAAMYEITDVKSGFWQVRGSDTAAMTTTPFSGT